MLDVLPDALVVRTSAFFGPWDAHNFVVRTLDAIQRGEPWRAAADVVVSPTYVPDLVDATLDLLIDSERGIWHLTNDGAVVVVRVRASRGAGLRRAGRSDRSRHRRRSSAGRRRGRPTARWPASAAASCDRRRPRWRRSPSSVDAGIAAACG